MRPIEMLNYGKTQLGDSKYSDARILLEHCLKSKTSEFFSSTKNIGKGKKTLFDRLLAKRKTGQPTSYIMGQTEFMGLTFFVNKNVLIPRQETENLVEEAIKILTVDRHPASLSFQRGRPSAVNCHPSTDNCRLLSVLDIGTGSGNIAVSVAKYVPNAKIVAMDISKKALAVAKKNAKLNSVSKQIVFLQHDALNPSTVNLQPSTKFDLIISNPPYIRTSELKKLQKEIGHEPVIALNGGNDGLDFYKTVIPTSKRLLKKNGYLMFEIGYHHSEHVEHLMLKNGFKNIHVVKDYLHEERVIYGQNHN